MLINRFSCWRHSVSRFLYAPDLSVFDEFANIPSSILEDRCGLLRTRPTCRTSITNAGDCRDEMGVGEHHRQLICHQCRQIHRCRVPSTTPHSTSKAPSHFLVAPCCIQLGGQHDDGWHDLGNVHACSKIMEQGIAGEMRRRSAQPKLCLFSRQYVVESSTSQLDDAFRTDR